MAEYTKAPHTPLETKRLILRPLSQEHAPRIQELFDNFNVLKYLFSAIPWPYPSNGAEEHLARVLPRQEEQLEYNWAITLKDSPELGLVGVIGLTPTSEHDHRGFWLGEPYWGQGLMKEAVGAVNDFAFDQLQMSYLLLNNAEPNTASHLLKLRAGAEIIGTEQISFIGGDFNSIRWRLTKENWTQHRASFLA